MRYKIVVDHWAADPDVTPKPLGWIVNPVAYEGDDAATAATVYAACCLALKAGGCYRSDIGVFFYTEGKITDRYLIEDGRVVRSL